MNSDLTKLALRKSFLKKRLALSGQEHEDKSFAIANNCLTLPIWHLEYYHLYLPIKAKAEIDTTLILTLLQGKDKQVILPRTKGSELEHILLTDITKLKINGLGIPEPEKGIKISPEQIDVIFLPLLAWDKRGNRLGYGKGFYDNFLSLCRKNTIKVGLSFFDPVEKIIDIRSKDIQMDFCVNPEGIKKFTS
tara:strand:- start:1335 stop:1910 length:576 start_codon:yes stop_codon:yes gene_type:complete